MHYLQWNINFFVQIHLIFFVKQHVLFEFIKWKYNNLQ